MQVKKCPICGEIAATTGGHIGGFEELEVTQNAFNSTKYCPDCRWYMKGELTKRSKRNRRKTETEIRSELLALLTGLRKENAAVRARMREMEREGK